MRVADQKNFVASLMFIAFGVTVSIWSLSFKIGTASRMGPGYFPLIVGLALCIVGVVVLVGSLGAETRSRVGTLHLKPVLIISAAVASFGALVKPAGLVIAVLALIGISAFAETGRSWRVVLLAIAILLPLAWLIFVALLGLPLDLLPPVLAT